MFEAITTDFPQELGLAGLWESAQSAAQKHEQQDFFHLFVFLTKLMVI
jgi:hypothetical protein